MYSLDTCLLFSSRHTNNKTFYSSQRRRINVKFIWNIFFLLVRWPLSHVSRDAEQRVMRVCDKHFAYSLINNTPRECKMRVMWDVSFTVVKCEAYDMSPPVSGIICSLLVRFIIREKNLCNLRKSSLLLCVGRDRVILTGWWVRLGWVGVWKMNIKGNGKKFSSSFSFLLLPFSTH